jgi:5-methylcytosine-specific restriction endonuclease McrA
MGNPYKVHSESKARTGAQVALVFVCKSMSKFPKFYGSTQWQDCRTAYMKYRHGLCEDCLAKGIFTPAEIVHHVIELTPDNIDNPNITLSFGNLRAVCRSCHLEEHGLKKRRYEVTPDGRVISPRPKRP